MLKKPAERVIGAEKGSQKNLVYNKTVDSGEGAL